MATRTAARIRQVLRAHGRLVEQPGEPGQEGLEPDDLGAQQPVLRSCYHASARGRYLLGQRAGKPSLRLLDPAKAARSAELAKTRAKAPAKATRWPGSTGSACTRKAASTDATASGSNGS